MQKIDLGQTISILANIGVIAGIIFLGVELRQNNELLRSDATRGYMINRVETNQRLADSTEIVPLRLKAARGEPLTDAEVTRLFHDASASMTLWEWEWQQYEAGLLEYVPTAGYRSVVRRYPHIQAALSEIGPSLDPRFVEWFQQNVLSER